MGAKSSCARCVFLYSLLGGALVFPSGDLFASVPDVNVNMVQQQSKKVVGIVTDAQGEALIGVNIVVKGKDIGGITDINGRFSMDVEADDVLEFSYIGYESQQIKVGRHSSLNITLIEDSQDIDEIVVVGYGVQKKATLTGAVAAVNSEEITRTKNQYVSNTLSGKIAGLRVHEKTGEPGAMTMQDFQIRGMGSPLVIIDGVPRSDMNNLDPNEIESVSVLKDASAAIYGVRAANGVILVTTKKGTPGKTRFNYNGFFGVQKAIGLPEVLDAVGYMTLMNERELNNKRSVLFSEEQIEEYRNGTKTSTDWAHMGQRKYAPQHQHNLSVNGGSEKVSYFVNFGYVSQESLFESNSLNYERYNIRSNITAQLSNRLKAQAIIGGYMDVKHNMSQNASQVYKGAWSIEPIISTYANDDPRYLSKVADGLHPLAIADRDVSGYNDRRVKKFMGTFNLEYKIPYIDGLVAKGSYSYDYKNQDTKTFKKAFDLWEYSAEDDKYLSSSYMSPSNITRGTIEWENTLLQLSLNYSKTFLRDHQINALFLYEEEMQRADNFSAYRETTMDVIDELFAGYTENQKATQNTGNVYERTNKGFVGRIDYNYKSKYMIEVSARYDGSSKFAPNHRWGFFPAVTGGWRISEERFFKEQVPFVDNLKIRASYGLMGSDEALDYQFLQGYTYPSGGYFFDTYVSAVGRSKLPNPEISWYDVKTTDIGLDFTLWKGLLSGSVDYFVRKRDGLLADSGNSLPSTLGANMAQGNLNSDKRYGFEFELSHKNRINKFNYRISANFSWTRHKVLYRERAESTSYYDNWRNNASYRHDDFLWGYGVNGQFTSFEEIYNAPILDSKGNSSYFPGGYDYEDWNGDGVIDALDQHPIAPKGQRISYGFTLEALYNGFDFSAVFQGLGIVLRSYPAQFEQPLEWGRNGLAMFLDRWHRADEFDPDSEWIPGKYPSTYRDTPAEDGYNRASLKNRLNGSYLRLKSLEVGYSLPKTLLSKVGIQGVRVYLNAYNLLTFSPLNGIVDPERPDNSDSGYTYPTTATYNIGVNLSF